MEPDPSLESRAVPRLDLARAAAGVSVLSAVLLAAGCGVAEVVIEAFRGETPHERYAELLERSGLGETALARDWAHAAEDALRAPVLALPPMTEEGWFPAEAPLALGYRFEATRGQRIRVRLDLEPEQGDDDVVVFMEIFRVRGDPDAESPALLAVAWADSLTRELVHDANTSATYVVRVQPELLRGGAYQLSLETGPSLAFPVQGASQRDVGSFFGASRDGGARQHHGVDIFAPRGTPVLAASDGYVRRVGETPLGGKVVWLRNEERGHSEYYAHLDAQLVESGQRVKLGDTLGLVGNTGNAISTPPHLHFGIYSRGPVDPFPFLARAPGAAPRLTVERDLFHTRARIRSGGAPIHDAPTATSEPLAPGEEHLPVHVLAGSGEWVRVRLPDGRHGFVHHERVEPVEDAVAVHLVANGELLRGTPDRAAPGFRRVAPGSELEVLARYGAWAWVRAAGDTRPGWVSAVDSGLRPDERLDAEVTSVGAPRRDRTGADAGVTQSGDG